MKTAKLMIAASCLAALGAMAQYGRVEYPHANSILSSAKVTNNFPGFVMSGFTPAAAGSQPDFVIDKVDGDGLFTAGTFAQQYEIWDNTSCNPQARVYDCSGVSVIETNNQGNGEAYALAGAYNKGVFFATLDNTGNVITVKRWIFPNGITVAHKPMIVESPSTPGRYYICGDQAARTYVIKVNALGTTAFENIYDNIWSEARAIIESPYNPNEVVVVGRCDPGAGLATEAFFLKLDANNGNVLNFNCYSDGGNGDEWFTSIQPAASTNAGSNGYIIGGRVVSSILLNYTYIPWMIKLDPAGNVLWSTLIEPAGGFELEINDVFERYNPWAAAQGLNPYEYYGVAGCTANGADNMTIWKLDDNGLNSLLPNEFIYPLGAGGNIWYAQSSTQLEVIGDGSNAGDGFQAWSTDYAGNNHIFTRAYFNGVIGCNEILSRWRWHQGPKMTINPNTNIINFPPDCANNTFNLITPGVNAAIGAYCWAQTVGGGSNNRATAITENKLNSEGQGVYPSPTNGKALVSFNAADNSTVIIEVRNSLGQVIKTTTAVKSNAGSYQEEIDFESLNAAPGVYFVNVTVDRAATSHKIIYMSHN
jgi:hypothetical protein